MDMMEDPFFQSIQQYNQIILNISIKWVSDKRKEEQRLLLQV